MDDTERRAGLDVTTRGTRIGWLMSEVSFVAIASEQWWLDTVRKACWGELSVGAQLKQTFVLYGSQGMTNFRFKKAENRLIRQFIR